MMRGVLSLKALRFQLSALAVNTIEQTNLPKGANFSAGSRVIYLAAVPNSDNEELRNVRSDDYSGRHLECSRDCYELRSPLMRQLRLDASTNEDSCQPQSNLRCTDDLRRLSFQQSRHPGGSCDFGSWTVRTVRHQNAGMHRASSW